LGVPKELLVLLSGEMVGFVLLLLWSWLMINFMLDPWATKSRALWEEREGISLISLEWCVLVGVEDILTVLNDRLAKTGVFDGV